MPVKYRLLALLLYGIHILAPLRWLAGLGLTVLGVYTVSRAGLSAALPWWAGAVLVVAPSLVTALRGYTVFVPTGEPVTEVPPSAPEPAYALASGPLRTRAGFRWLPLHRVEAEPVQVRWLAGGKPPALAVLCPPDMPLTLPDPLAEADAAGLFYPGMEVRLGTVAVGAKLYTGLQATFPGKQLVLAFTEPRAADAYGGALKLFRVI